MPVTSASCWSMSGCRSRGSPRNMCSRSRSSYGPMWHGRAHLDGADLSAAGANRSRWRYGSSTPSVSKPTSYEPNSERLPAASRGAEPWSMNCTGWVSSPRRSSGPRWVTLAGSRRRVRRCVTPGSISRRGLRMGNAPGGVSLGKDPRRCGGRCSKPPYAPPAPARRIIATSSTSKSVSGRSERICRWPASWPAGSITSYARSVTPRSNRSPDRYL